ncbi:MAG TPA: glycosyltransferase family 39 protein [Spirochaetota bacterium]|nr:glycosyltransferase family 39 protein [Spirochaetota bacterium]
MNRFAKYTLWIAGLIFVLRIPVLYQHIIDIDETAFSEFASIMLNGGLPYIDAVDNKPPMTYYFFYLVYALTGIKSLITVHFFTTIWVIITGICIYLFGNRLKDDKTGLVASLLFVFMMHTYEPKYISSNGETLINLFLVLSSYIFLFINTAGARKILLHILSGVLLGLAIMTNYKAGILAFVFIIQSLIIGPFLSHNRQIRFMEGLVKLFITGFSSFIPVVLFAFFFHVKGNLNEAVFWGFLYNFGYIESGKGAFSSLKIVGRTGYFILLTLPAWIAALKYISANLKKFKLSGRAESVDAEYSHFAFLTLWLGFSIYGAAIGGRGYGHYFIQIVPPLALISAAGYTFVKQYKKTFWLWLLLPAVIFTASRIDIIKTYEILNYPNYKSEISFRKAGEYIKSVSAPDDRIYAWGWATPVYYFADRRSASRFIISDFVSGRVFGTANTSGAVRNELTEKFLPVLIEDLKKNKPRYFVDTSPSGFFGYDRFPLKFFPELNSFINNYYDRETEIDGLVVYRRRDI